MNPLPNLTREQIAELNVTNILYPIGILIDSKGIGIMKFKDYCHERGWETSDYVIFVDYGIMIKFNFLMIIDCTYSYDTEYSFPNLEPFEL